MMNRAELILMDCQSEATQETVQTLSDGNQIIRKNQSKLYRDSERRTRIEQTLETMGKWTAEVFPRTALSNTPEGAEQVDCDEEEVTP